MTIVSQFATIRKDLEIELENLLLNYDGVQSHELKALSRKINHMCINIGCPNSVEPMLKSIIKGNIKKWVTPNHMEGGKQLRGLHITEIERKYGNKTYKNNGTDIVIGHFRWDFKAYKLDRYTRDYLNYFYFSETKPNINYDLRFKVLVAIPTKLNDTTYSIEITTASNNTYRYVYYSDTDTYVCNIGNQWVSDGEKRYIRDLLNRKFRLKLK